MMIMNHRGARGARTSIAGLLIILLSALHGVEPASADVTVTQDGGFLQVTADFLGAPGVPPRHCSNIQPIGPGALNELVTDSCPDGGDTASGSVRFSFSPGSGGGGTVTFEAHLDADCVVVQRP